MVVIVKKNSIHKINDIIFRRIYNAFKQIAFIPAFNFSNVTYMSVLSVFTYVSKALGNVYIFSLKCLLEIS